MPASQLITDGPEFQCRDGETLALDAAEYLANQLAFHAVGLDQYEGPFGHGAQQ
ncbi:MAG: hypothetical protein QOF15_3261, partial [Mycobacterium sp.]|nr:hypothetical protein [Mycobacterium sp.]